MAKRSIQGYVELASGLGELTRSAAKEAAAEILALAGSDASRKKAAKQVSGLADELLHAAQSNRKDLVRLVRREVDSAVGKLDVNRLSGDVQTLAATVAGLASQVDDLARSATGMNTRTPGPVADALADLGPEPARVAARPARRRRRRRRRRLPRRRLDGREEGATARRRPRPRRHRPRSHGEEDHGEEDSGQEGARDEGRRATKAHREEGSGQEGAPAKTAPPDEVHDGQEGSGHDDSAAKKTTTARPHREQGPGPQGAGEEDPGDEATATPRHPRRPRPRHPRQPRRPGAHPLPAPRRRLHPARHAGPPPATATPAAGA